MACRNGSAEVFKHSEKMKREEFAAKRRAMSRNTIPELIDLLENELLETRFLAEMCLRDATAA